MVTRLRILRSVLVVALAVMLGGCAKPPAPSHTTPPRPPTVRIDDDGASLPQAWIYIPKMVGGELKISPEKAVLPENAGKYAALDMLLDHTIDGHRIFPKGVRVVSVKVDGKGVGSLVLSKEIRNYTGGTTEESAAVNSLVLTTIERFPKVKQVRILAEDGELETLGGGADLTIPVQPDRNMIVSAR